MQKLRAQIAALQDATMDENKNFRTAYDEGKFDALTAVDALLDSLQEEPVAPKVLEDMLNAKTAAESLGISQEEHDRIVDELIYGKEPELVDDLSNKEKEPASEDLEEAANDYAHDLLHDDVFETFIAGAQWQKEHLWKPADGDDLPDIDMEVIVLYQPYPCEGNEYAVSFAHRPHEFLDLKNTHTGEITRFEPARYDKWGWNIPDVKFWLDCDLPKMERYEDCYNEVIKSTQNGIGNTKY